MTLNNETKSNVSISLAIYLTLKTCFIYFHLISVGLSKVYTWLQSAKEVTVKDSSRDTSVRWLNNPSLWTTSNETSHGYFAISIVTPRSFIF